MAFQLTQKRISFQMPLDLNQPRLNALQKALAPKFPKMELGPVLMFRNPDGIGIGVAPGQIQLDLSPRATTMDFTEAASHVAEVLELMMLEDQAVPLLDIVASGDFVDVNIGKKFLEQNQPAPRILGEHLPGIFAVGHRYMFRDGDITGDLRVEPVYVEPSKLWCQLTMTLAIMPISEALAEGDRRVRIMRDELLPRVEAHFASKE